MAMHAVEVTRDDYHEKLDYLALRLSAEFISPEVTMIVLCELAKNDYFVFHKSELMVVN